MNPNHWGKYQEAQPETHFDPLQSFIVDNRPVGFRVNFMPGRRNRPREQSIRTPKSFLQEEITDEEIRNSPLHQVIIGKAPAVPIAGDDQIIGDPSDEPRTMEFLDYDGVTIMNKYAPLGLYSQQASGVAMVNFATKYTRTLNNYQTNYHLLVPMRRSIQYLTSGQSYRDDLRTPVCFFNIGPGSGASIRYLHSQTYILPAYGGTISYAFQQAFNQNDDCLACRMANQKVVTDHLGQVIDYHQLTIWEDDHIRVIVPYAPLRTMATRILPKGHIAHLGQADDEQLTSIAKGLSIADYLMNAATPSGRTVRLDRSIPFRQAARIDANFHLFIDLLPPFPFVAAEVTDFLGMTPYRPDEIATRMNQVDERRVEQLLDDASTMES